MKTNKIYHIVIGTFLCLVSFSACLKKEFMPTPIGETIPYQDSIPTFYEAFSNPNYSLFLHAWRRSTIPSKVSLQDTKAKFTLFVPDNQAMTTAGFSLAKINQMAQRDIDSLVAYHTIKGQLTKTTIEQSKGNTSLATYLVHPTELEYVTDSNGETYGETPYVYRINFGVDNDNTIVYGRPLGKVKDVVESKQATLIPVNKVVQRPTQTTTAFLEKDGRFKLYLKTLAYNDSIYDEIQAEANPYYYEPEGARLRLSRLEAYISTSILAPTDEAFHKAGIYSMNDIKRLNDRHPVYTINYYGTMSNYTVTDSILNNHWWQVNPWNVISTHPKGMDSYHLAKGAFTPFSTFYSNDLKNELLANIILSWENYLGYQIDANNLEFNRDNNADKIRVKVKGSTYEAANVTEKDIITFTGVVHVVDRLLLPKGFKLN